MAYLIETIKYALCLEEFLKDERGFQQSLIPKIQQLIASMKQLYEYAVQRPSGDGMNLIKFHLLDHLVEDIKSVGCPSYVSGGPDEANHKTNKAAAKRTQKSAETFDLQQSVKMVELHAIAKAQKLVEKYGTRGHSHKKIGETSCLSHLSQTAMYITRFFKNVSKSHKQQFEIQVYTELKINNATVDSGDPDRDPEPEVKHYKCNPCVHIKGDRATS